MKFPNAASGVNKIFIAEILALAGAVLTFIGAIMAVLALSSSEGGQIGMAAGTGIGALGVMSIAGILMVVAFVLNLIGIINASKDEASFKTALYCLLIGIITSVLASVFSTNAIVANICTILSNVMNLIVTVMVIVGISKLANKLGNPAISARGSFLLKLIVAIYVLSLICSIIVAFLGGQAASIIAAILAVIATVLSILQYILYIGFLAKAKNMLANS